MICGALIEGPAAALVVLHDERAMLARLAHPDCSASGLYAWAGTSQAIAGLTLRPDGLDVATALVWRPGRAGASSRAIVLLEPRIHISLDGGDQDPLERLFARPLGLHPGAGARDALRPPTAPGTTLTAAPGGLRLRSAELTVSIPADTDTLTAWQARADGGRASVVLGRGLGISGPEAELAATVAEALALRPCWGALVTVG